MPQILVAWLPLGLIPVGYALAYLVNRSLADTLVEGARNAAGFGLHLRAPIVVDEWLFGRLPTIWLQEHLWTAGTVRWYDAIGALIYASHFVVIPVLSILTWFRARFLFRRWTASVLVLTAVGVATYIAYPMAPPWLAAELGITGPIERISGIGWQFFSLDVVDGLLGGSQNASNPVAAMPSLHAGTAALVALFWWPTASILGRIGLVLYPLAMGLVLVYTGEHYVWDVLAGFLVAAVAVFGVIGARGLRARRLRENHPRETDDPTKDRTKDATNDAAGRHPAEGGVRT